MERQGVSEERAYTELRTYSQRTGLSLRARAEQIIASAGRHRRARAAPMAGTAVTDLHPDAFDRFRRKPD